jgi:hypothetical protein
MKSLWICSEVCVNGIVTRGTTPRSELSRQKTALQNKLSDRAVQKRLAESTSESPAKRAAARAKFNALDKEISAAEAAIKKLEASVKKEQSRKTATEVKSNYDRLKSQYDLVIDKSSPEAKALAERVNAEVVKLNNAYQDAGSTTRVKPVSTQAAPISQSQSAAEQGRAAVRGTKTDVTLATPEKTGADKTPTDGKTPAAGKTPPAAGGDKKPKTKEELYADAIALAVEKYNMPDIIFKNVDSLRILLDKYVNNKLTDEQFKREIELDPWYRSNSAEIKARYVQLYNYDDLVKKGLATGTTDYEQKINSITRKIQAKARGLNGIDIPEDQAKLMAKDLYIYNLDNDPAVLTERLARFIRPSAGMIGGVPTTGYGGQALQNYQLLQSIAKANGMKIQDLLPRDAAGQPMTAEGTLEQLATGKLDINRIAQDARKLAALGQPEFVKDLLGQGYDLETIYSPYRNTMANILELDPNTISLSDPGLRMGISKEGDMNLYDYERALRKDNRWQYTQQARGEVADSALRVLRDFGFAG